MSFDTDQFIGEVECRRAIWDTTSPEYAERDRRRKQWDEIVDLYDATEGLTPVEKKDLGILLRKRWKNLRDCYVRELRRIKKNNGAIPRKGPYVFYQQLSFLRKITDDTETLEDDPEDPEYKPNVSKVEYLDGEDVNGHSYCSKETTASGSKRGRNIKRKGKKFDKESPSRQSGEFNNDDEVDEDKMFLLSLVSAFKAIPAHKKGLVKIRILQVFEENKPEPPVLPMTSLSVYKLGKRKRVKKEVEVLEEEEEVLEDEDFS